MEKSLPTMATVTHCPVGKKRDSDSMTSDDIALLEVEWKVADQYSSLNLDHVEREQTVLIATSEYLGHLENTGINWKGCYESHETYRHFIHAMLEFEQLKPQICCLEEKRKRQHDEAEAVKQQKQKEADENAKVDAYWNEESVAARHRAGRLVDKKFNAARNKTRDRFNRINRRENDYLKKVQEVVRNFYDGNYKARIDELMSAGLHKDAAETILSFYYYRRTEEEIGRTVHEVASRNRNISQSHALERLILGELIAKGE